MATRNVLALEAARQADNVLAQDATRNALAHEETHDTKPATMLEEPHLRVSRRHLGLRAEGGPVALESCTRAWGSEARARKTRDQRIPNEQEISDAASVEEVLRVAPPDEPIAEAGTR